MQHLKREITQLSDGKLSEIITLLDFSSKDGVSSVNNGFCVLVKELVKSGGNVYSDVQLNISSPFINEVSRTTMSLLCILCL